MVSLKIIDIIAKDLDNWRLPNVLPVTIALHFTPLLFIACVDDMHEVSNHFHIILFANYTNLAITTCIYTFKMQQETLSLSRMINNEFKPKWVELMKNH